MMGKDIERILSGIDSVKESSSECIDSLTTAISKEVPQKYPSIPFVSPITSSMSGMSGDCDNMDSLRNSLYTNSKSFNNSYGSPWTELDRLQDAVRSADSFAASHNPFQYIGEKIALLGLINKVMITSVDARWAIMHFHDYIQRGYDHEFNGDIPSITFQDGKGNATVGNIDHEYDDNVHIPKPPTYPY